MIVFNAGIIALFILFINFVIEIQNQGQAPPSLTSTHFKFCTWQ